MFIIDIMMKITDIIWGWPILLITLGVAVVLSVKLRFFQLTHFGCAMKNTFGKIFEKNEGKGSVSPLQACCTALASTLGVGNIAGVSVAIAFGGPGAIFWMWVVACLGLIVKFSEIVLALAFRTQDPETGVWRGGFYWYVRHGLGEAWKPLAIIWAITLGLALIMGPAVQANSVVGAVNTYFDVSPLAMGIGIAVLMAIVLIGGIKSLSRFAEIVVPFMAVAYLLASIFVLTKYGAEIPAAFGMIFKDAFTGSSAAGGFAGSTVMLAIRWGLARGVFSNEAGTGTAPLVHSSAAVNHPVKQGFWGIVEVFVDTIVVCTMTALVVLVTGVYETGESGTALTTLAFSEGFGSALAGCVFITVVILFFAYTSAVVNVYYGEICVGALGGKKIALNIYRLLGCIFAVIGATGALSVIWSLFDFFFGLCALMNLVVLCLMRKQVYNLVQDYLARVKNGNWIGKEEVYVAVAQGERAAGE